MDGPASSGDRVRFGAFELDARSGELRKRHTRLRVPDQSIHILAALLERPGELVTREHLRERLWPSDTFVDFEHSLNAAVRRLREALGDSADAPRYVETLPRRGYRFIGQIDPPPADIASLSAPTVAVADPSAAMAATATIAPQADVRAAGVWRLRRTTLATIAVLVIAPLALAVWT